MKISLMTSGKSLISHTSETSENFLCVHVKNLPTSPLITHNIFLKNLLSPFYIHEVMNIYHWSLSSLQYGQRKSLTHCLPHLVRWTTLMFTVYRKILLLLLFLILLLLHSYLSSSMSSFISFSQNP